MLKKPLVFILITHEILILELFGRKAPNVGAGTCGIWGRREEAQKSLHETMRLAEARFVQHAPGGSMPS